MIADEYKQNSSLETDIGKGITEIISGVSKQKKTFKQNLKSVKNKDAKILLEQSLKRTKIKRTEGKKSQYSLSKNFILSTIFDYVLNFLYDMHRFPGAYFSI